VLQIGQAKAIILARVVHLTAVSLISVTAQVNGSPGHARVITAKENHAIAAELGGPGDREPGRNFAWLARRQLGLVE